MKVIRFPIALGLILVLGGLSAAMVTAAGPVGSSPDTAAYLNSRTHQAPPNSSFWYKFDYPGDESDLSLRIPGGAGRGMAFALYSPSQIHDWWNEAPFGRGADLDDHSLFWTGQVAEAGTFYVKFDNNNPFRKFYQLLIDGTDFSLGPQPAEEEEPSETTPPPVNADASGALAVDSAVHTIDGGGTLWYRYTYPGNSQVTIRIKNGNASGMSLTIFTSNQMSDWWNEDPLAIGTPASDDSFDDLSWVGSTNNGETLYLQIQNPNPWSLDFAIDVSARPLGK